MKMSFGGARRVESHPEPAPAGALRLAFVIPMMGAGGAERVAATLCNEWTQQGHEVHLVTFEHRCAENHYFLKSDLRLHRLDLLRRSRSFASFAYLNLKRVSLLRTTLRAIAPDAVISFMPEPNVLTILASLGQCWPVVVSERVHPAYLPLARVPAIMRRIAYPRAAAVAVQAQVIADYVENAFRVSTTIIPNPVDLTRFTATGRKHTISRDRKRIVSMGRLESQKGFDLLIDAFSRLASGFPDWILVIFGDGSCRAALEEQIATLGLKDRVRLPGTIADVAGELQQADIYAQCSRFEGTPNTVIEALACGCPIVATDCPGGIREIIGDSIYGTLVPVNDPAAFAHALAHLMEDEAARTAMSVKAPEAVAELSAPAIAMRWIDLLRRILAQRPSNAKMAAEPD